MKQYTFLRFIGLLCLLLFLFMMSCRVYHNSQHNETNHTTKEGNVKTVIKKPQQVILSPFDSNSVSIAAHPLGIDTTFRILNSKRISEASGLGNPYFDQQIQLLLDIEGGYQNDNRDLSNLSGRGTKYGITAETAKRFEFGHLPSADQMKALTEVQAKRIYRKYYESYYLDKIQDNRLGWLVFDALVNMPSRVPLLIQHGLERQGIEVDSAVGNRWNQDWVEATNEAESYKLFEDFWNARYTYYEHRTGRLDSNSVYFAYYDSLWSPRLQDSLYINGWLNRMAHLKERL